MIVKVSAHCIDSFYMRSDAEPHLIYEGYVPDIFAGGGDDLNLEIDTETMKIINFTLPKTFSLLDLNGIVYDNEKSKWVSK